MIQRFIGPIMFLISIFVVNRYSDMPFGYTAAIFGVTSVAWYFIYPKRIEMNLKKQVMQRFSEGQNKDLLAENDMTVNEKEIIRVTDYKTTNIKWKTINKIEITKKHIFIFDSAISAIIIPMTAFESESNKKEFVDTIKEYFDKSR